MAGAGLLILAGCGGGGGSPSSNIGPPPVVSVALQPAPPSTMAVTAVARVGAGVSNDTGSATLNWTVTCGSSDCGKFSSSSTASGTSIFYSAPNTIPTGNTVVVTATLSTDSTKSATATVTISPTPSANFFVATDGNDTWSGKLPGPNPTSTDGPFATIAHAQKAVQGILSGLTNSVVVMVRGGATPYFLTQPLSFTAADSGTPLVNISWQAYPGESPVISGGMQVTNWTQGSGNQWTATLPPGTQYFEQLFYNGPLNQTNGQRRLRPRLGGSFVGTYFRIAAPVSVPTAETNCPDLGQGSPFECYDRFQYTLGDPISASWTNLSPPNTGPFPCDVASGNPYPTGDIALYSFEQMGMSKMLIDCIDTASQIIYLTGPIRIPTVANDTTTGFVAGRRYLVENVKNALTQPGQWFLDRSQTPWTLTYLANSGENPNTDTVIIPQASQVLVATNLQNVTFGNSNGGTSVGLTFEHDNFTVPAAGNPYMRLDQNITSAVSCQNCQNVIFDGDIITQTAGTGIDFTTTAANSTSANNAFQNGGIIDVAAHGIRIGLLASGSDTFANLPHSTTVENNVITGIGRIFAKGFGIAQGCNHDNLYTHNEIYDGYSGGINIGALNCGVSGTSFTSGNIASFNNVSNLGQGVTNDFGCVYFNTTPVGGVPPTGNQAMNNVCHDVTDAGIVDPNDGYGGQGIYLDNNTGSVEVQNNLVYRVSASTVAQTCGPQGVQGSPNIIKNNILAFSRQSIKQQGCTPSGPSNKLFDMTNNLVIFDMGNIQGGCYSCLGGNCSSVLPATVHLESNLYCYAPNGSCTLPTNRPAFFSSDDPPNQSGRCNQLTTTTYSSLTDWQSRTAEDSGSGLGNPFSSVQSSNNTYSLSASPGVGFVLFDPSQAGRTTTTITPPVVPATFPAQSYSPSQF